MCFHNYDQLDPRGRAERSQCVEKAKHIGDRRLLAHTVGRPCPNIIGGDGSCKTPSSAVPLHLASSVAFGQPFPARLASSVSFGQHPWPNAQECWPNEQSWSITQEMASRWWDENTHSISKITHPGNSRRDVSIISTEPCVYSHIMLHMFPKFSSGKQQGGWINYIIRALMQLSPSDSSLSPL